MSRYNKAECIHAYTAAYGLQPKHIIFVDDFCQNAFNVAWFVLSAFGHMSRSRSCATV